MVQQENRRGWHFDRTVNIPTMITAVTLTVYFGLYLTNMDKQQALMQLQILNQQKQMEQMGSILGEGNIPLRRDVDRIQNELEKVNEKLDRIGEKLSQSGRLSKTRYLKDYQ